MLSESCHIYLLLLFGLLNRSTNFIQLSPRRIKNSICEETLIWDLTVQGKITPNITVQKRLRIRKMDKTTCVIKFKCVTVHILLEEQTMVQPRASQLLNTTVDIITASVLNYI